MTFIYSIKKILPRFKLLDVCVCSDGPVKILLVYLNGIATYRDSWGGSDVRHAQCGDVIA